MNKFDSRKYRLTLLALLSLILGFVVSSTSVALSNLYSIFVSSILGLVGLYYGSNVMQKVFVKSPNLQIGSDINELDRPGGTDSKNNRDNSEQSCSRSADSNVETEREL